MSDNKQNITPSQSFNDSIICNSNVNNANNTISITSSLRGTYDIYNSNYTFEDSVIYKEIKRQMKLYELSLCVIEEENLKLKKELKLIKEKINRLL